MSTIVLDNDVRIPGYVTDLDSFCEWCGSADFPETGQFSFFNGEIWVDMSPERIPTHNQSKQEFTRVLGNLAVETKRGRFYPDGALLRNNRAKLSTEPDGMFVSKATRRAKKIRITRTKTGLSLLVGSPDMTLEILSKSSRRKDLVVLRKRYWLAGVKEYWLVGTKRGKARLVILKRGTKGFTAVRAKAGWVASKVFGKEFRLRSTLDEFGDPEYTLEAR